MCLTSNTRVKGYIYNYTWRTILEVEVVGIIQLVYYIEQVYGTEG